jgi:hypothetical protein
MKAPKDTSRGALRRFSLTTHHRRQHGAVDGVAIAPLLFLATLLIVVVVWLCRKEPKPKTEAERYVPGTMANPSRSENVETIEHDGHFFVIWYGSQKGTLLHHPGCPCPTQRLEVKP